MRRPAPAFSTSSKGESSAPNENFKCTFQLACIQLRIQPSWYLDFSSRRTRAPDQINVSLVTLVIVILVSGSACWR
ncbi:hypothetical protein PAXRUDRAFT_219322 [Paxillus rubicundulus Ve08.2h10]|uniref:Uncharacterized protein n=1 Tax=Paxillus rubicundulus Ve08.2h10 TaxID=930991 RepID=A0A0D0CDQ9_9AGAM|nr:hypothetical protein PAXRUDRAFT_219322 [Paxillus rubicundulus Ve08.2h10]